MCPLLITDRVLSSLKAQWRVFVMRSLVVAISCRVLVLIRGRACRLANVHLSSRSIRQLLMPTRAARRARLLNNYIVRIDSHVTFSSLIQVVRASQVPVILLVLCCRVLRLLLLLRDQVLKLGRQSSSHILPSLR